MHDENIFTIKGAVYVATDCVSGCSGCSFGYDGGGCPTQILCWKDERKDNRSIIWQKAITNIDGTERSNIKIWCNDEAQGERIQEALFNIGYQWRHGTYIQHPCSGGYCLCCDSQGFITWDTWNVWEYGTHHTKCVLDDKTNQLLPERPLSQHKMKYVSVADVAPPLHEEVMVWPRPDFGIKYYTGHYIKKQNKGIYNYPDVAEGWFCAVYEEGFGQVMKKINVTHWAPLPEEPHHGND